MFRSSPSTEGGAEAAAKAQPRSRAGPPRAARAAPPPAPHRPNSTQSRVEGGKTGLPSPPWGFTAQAKGESKGREGGCRRPAENSNPHGALSQGASPSCATAWRPPPARSISRARRCRADPGRGATTGPVPSEGDGGPGSRHTARPPAHAPPHPALTKRCGLAAAFGVLLIVALPPRLPLLGGQLRQRGLRSLLRCHLLRRKPGGGRREASRGRGTRCRIHTPLL